MDSLALGAFVDRPPIPLRVSPNGRLVLTKQIHPSAFALGVLSRDDGRVVATLESESIHMAASWSSDGAAIGYLADSVGDQQYRPRLFDMRTGTLVTVDAPATSAYRLQWRPKSSTFAYVLCEPRSRTCAIRSVDASRSSLQRQLVGGVDPRATFAWSHESGRIATVAASPAGALLVTDAAGGASRHLLSPGATIADVSWVRDDRAVIASVRPVGEEHFQLWLVPLGRGGLPHAVVRDTSDLSSAVATRHGVLLYRSLRDGVSSLRAASLEDLAARPARHLGDGITAVGLSRNEDTVYANRESPAEPTALTAIAIASGREAPILADAWRHDVQAVLPRTLKLPARDGGVVPTHVWRSAGPDSITRGAVVLVHGGPNLHATRNWSPTTQYLARQGYHVLDVNYRGSTGFGRTFEKAPVRQGEDVWDVIGACDYAARTLGVPAHRIVVIGTSYGGSLALRAAASRPDAMGVVVLLSPAGPPAEPPSRIGLLPRVVAFHGENDVMQPEGAVVMRLRRFHQGRAEASRAPLINRVRSEGHVFHRQSTLASVHARALSALPKAAPTLLNRIIQRIRGLAEWS